MLTSHTEGENIAIAYDDTLSRTINFTLGGSATGWGSEITYTGTNANFIDLSLTEGADPTGVITIMATPMKNTGVERSATITLITTGHGGDSATAGVTITQAEAPGSPTLEITPPDGVRDTVAYTATTTSDSLEIVFTVGGSAMGWTSMISYGAEVDEFITLSDRSNVDQTGGVRIKVSVMDNEGVERSATITLSTTGQSANFSAATREITIIQRRAPPTLMLTSHTNGDSISIAYDDTLPGTINFTLGGSAASSMSNISYTPEDANFIMLQLENDNERTRTLTLTPSSNTSTEPRTATITLITTGHLGTPDSVSLTITQAAAPTLMLTSHTEGENISIAYDDTLPRTINFTLGGSAASSMSNISYTPEDVNFIMLQLENNNERERTLTLTPLANTSTEPRTATITLRTTGHLGTPDSVSLTITQAAAPTLMLTSHTEGENISIAYDDALPRTINFTLGGSATGWGSEITYTGTNANFIDLSLTEGADPTGVITIMATPMKNTGVERSATITLITTGHGGDSATAGVTITQAEAPGSPTLEITPPDGVRDTVAYTATTTSDSLEIVFTVGGSAMGWTSIISYGAEVDEFITLSDRSNVDQTGGVRIKVSVMENEGVERSATITLSTTGQSANFSAATREITIIQRRAPPTLMLTSHTNGDSISIAYDDTLPGTINFTLGGSAASSMSNISYTPEDANFIMLQLENDNERERTLTLTPLANTSTEPRTATITLRTTGHLGTPDSVSLTITQAAAPTLMLTSHTEGENISIAYDDTLPGTINFTLGGSAASSMSNISYTPEDVNFIMLQLENNNERERTLTLTPLANTSTEPRTATITLRTTGHLGTPDSVSLTITQAAAPTLMLTSHTEGENISIAYDDTLPRTINFTLGGSATGWGSEITYTGTNANFIDLSLTEGADPTGVITIMATPMKNTGVERSATITLITTGHGGDSATAGVTITQAEAPGSPTLEITPPDGVRDTVAYRATTTSDSLEIVFTVGGSAMGWTSIISYGAEVDEFITLSDRSNVDQTGGVRIKVSVMENEGVERSATITLSTTGQSANFSAVTREITIIQRRAPPTLMLTSHTNGDSISIAYDDTLPGTINFTLGGSAASSMSNISYTPEDANFIMLQLENDNEKERTLTLTPLANTSTEPRTATITLRTTGHLGTPDSVSLTITQAAAPTLMLTSHTEGENISIAYDDALPRTINFTLGGSAASSMSNISYTPEDVNFIMLQLENNNERERTLTLTPLANTSTEPRTATITLRTTGHEGTPDSVSLTITQAAAPTLMLTSHTEGENISIAYDDTLSRTINFTLGGSASSMSNISYTPEDVNFIMLQLENNNERERTLTLTPLANTSTEPRTATITLRTTGHEGTPDSVSLTITQAAAPTLMLTSHTEGENISIAYDDTLSRTINFTLGGSATGWGSEITYTGTNANFIDLSLTEGADPTGVITIMATPMKNTGVERSATITLITTGHGGDSATAGVTITQAEAPGSPTLEITPPDGVRDTVAYRATTTSDSLEIVFTVGGSAMGWTSIISYGAEVDEFITLSDRSNVDQTGGVRIKVSVMENEGVERSATITLSTTGQSANFSAVTREITIIQRRAPPTLMLTSHTNGDSISIAYDDTLPGTINFTLGGSAASSMSNISYTPEDANFIMLQLENDNERTRTLTLTPSSNTSTEPRTATITLITTGHLGTPDSVSLTITQAAAPTLMLTSHTEGENISIAYDDALPRTINFTLGGSAASSMSNISYTPEDVNFIMLQLENNNERERTLTLTPLANTSTEPRTATITLRTTGHEGTPDSVSLTITQAATPTLMLTSHTESENIAIAYDNTNPIPINFTLGGSAASSMSKISYTPEDANFIMLQIENNNARARTLTLTPLANTSAEPRIATITLRTTGHLGTPDSVSLTITQAARGDTTRTTLIVTTKKIHQITYDNIDIIPITFTLGGSITGWTSAITYTPANANFIDLSPTEGTDLTSAITIMATPTINTGVDRAAIITLKTTGEIGTPATQMIVITQGARADTTTLYSYTRVDFSLYPNPTKGKLTVEGVTGYLQIYIHDLVGREVMTYSLTPSKKTIDVSNLPSGMYVVTVQGEDKTWTEVLIMVNG